MISTEINIITVGVVVLYNPVIEEVINSINTYIESIDKLICIDNSIKNHKKYLKNEKIEYYSYGTNMGLSYALNDGCERAIECNASIIITFDQDSYFDVGCIEKLIQVVKCSSVFCVASPNIKRIIRNKDNSILVKQKPVFDAKDQNTSWVITSGCCFKSTLYKEVGGFDSKLFVGQIDQDFCYRVRRCGGKIIRHGNVFMEQEAGKEKEYRIFNRSFFSPNLSEKRYYYIFRNEYYLRKKWGNEYKECKVALYKYIFYIVFFEKNKIKKLVSILKGVKDSKKILQDRSI